MSLAITHGTRGNPTAARSPRTMGLFTALGPVWPILTVVYSFLLFPPEARISLLGVNLPLYRLTSLMLSWFWIRSFARRELRFSSPDLLVILASVWIIASFAHHYGSGSGTVRAMGVVIDTAGPYFIARACLRTPAHLRLVMLMLIPGLLLAGFEMLLESIRKSFIVRPAFAKVFGQLPAYSGGNEDGLRSFRQEFRTGGLMRAMGPFSHPILGGLILSTTLLLYLKSSIRSWPLYAGCLAAILGFFALSSATILALGMGFAFFFADKIIARIRTASWWAITVFVVMFGAILEFGTKSGLVNLLIRQTIDPQTGYYRKLIWEWGLKSVDRHKLFGIGYADYERPLAILPSGSVDAHFLFLAMVFGIIVPLAILLAAVIAQIKLGQVVAKGTGKDRDLLFALNAVLMILMISSMTVTYFGEARVWFMTIIGAAVSLGQLRLVKVPASAP